MNKEKRGKVSNSCSRSVGIMHITAFFLFSSGCLISCSKRDKPVQTDESDILYEGLITLVKEYSDILEQASDSASASEAFTRFNILLDSVNFAVAPDTDLLLTEAENDTLSNKILGVRKLYESKLTAPADTSNLQLQ